MRRVKWKKVRKAKNMWILLLVAALFLCGFDVTKAEAAQVLKVGYFDENGFVKEENGEYSGYTVEYLEKISEYTGWRYEFVFYDTWEKCIDKLESGELDLFCPMIYSEKRAETLVFTENPVGYASTILYVDENSDIYYGDTAELCGKKIGITPGSAQSEEFYKYANENDITDYEEVYFHKENEMLESLAAGEIDVAVLGSLAYHTDVRIIGKFGAQPLYCVSGKMNQNLIDTISEIIEIIQSESPGFASELEEKYYGNNILSDVPLFTREEVEYISSAEPIKLYMREEFAPVNYMENGQLSGILVEYVELISEKSGLEFDIEMEMASDTLSDYTQNIEKENSLVVRSKRAYEKGDIANNVLSTSPLMEMELSYAVRKGETLSQMGENCTIAAIYDMEYLENILIKQETEYQIKYYNTPEECMNAVCNGEADVVVLYNYVLRYLLQKPVYVEKLLEVAGEQIKNDICILGSGEDRMLITILNKTINHITNQEREEIVSREVLGKTYKNTLFDTLYEYRYILVGVVILLMIAAIVYVSVLKRISEIEVERKKTELEKQKYSMDELTQVYNRNTFFEKARHMIDNVTEDMCIVIMDITNFKVVNDLYGMTCGDRLLCQLAEELKQYCQGYDVVLARFSGDHFYMCMRDRDFQKIGFPKRYHTFLTEMDIKVTYGVFEIGDKRDTPINIMCDRASLAAHDKERTQLEYIRYYTEEERERIIREQEIANDMEKALASRQFCVYVQPKYDIYEEKIMGGEALVRWKHPQKGMIPPINFIGVFEKNGFIVRLDYYVWEETCRMISEMKKKNGACYPISINVSRAHFYGTELKSKLLELIRKYDLEPQDLELEITETICADDTDIIYKMIRDLQNVGFRVAMDDFGSGYSSLNMLKEMPLNIIKMDLKFLDGGDDIQKSHNILQTLITLAKSLGLAVVVEGVETQEQVEFLRYIGNQCVQGYYFSKPVEWKAYETMVAQQ